MGGRGDAPPLLLGLTGGIGAGKSAALAAFADCGAATLSSDEAVHRIYADPAVIAAVRERFGEVVVDSQGRVDRGALGARAFAEEGGLAFLEGLVHGRVARERRDWIAACLGSDPRPPLLVCEVPVLYEAGLEAEFDAVLVVTASDAVRRRRVEARGHDFDERSARQMPEAVKVARADRAVDNDGELADLRRWVADRFAEYAREPCRAPPPHD